MKTETNTKAEFRPKALTITLIVIALFAAAFILVLLLFRNESQSVETQFMQDETAKSGYIEIYAKSFSADPVKGELSTRLQFTPNGDLVNSDGLLTKDLTLYVNCASGKSLISFKKGETMNPIDVTIDIYGDIGFYPFDSHNGTLTLFLASETKDAQGSVTNEEMIPFTVYYSSALTGYRLDPTMGTDSDTGYMELNLALTRAATAMIFAIFIMILEWLLAFSAIGTTVVWLKGRKIEVSMFGWMGALLFALVPLRNAMPAVPPIGVLSDVIAFFWVEILVALCLVTAVVMWFKRGSTVGNPK